VGRSALRGIRSSESDIRNGLAGKARPTKLFAALNARFRFDRSCKDTQNRNMVYYADSCAAAR